MNARRTLAALAIAAALSAPAAHANEERAAFVDEVVAKHAVERGTVEAVLAKAKYQQSIIDAITRPAEAKPWKDYRPIFLTDKRIADGRAFLARHREALAQTEAATGVPAEFIVAILGVETSYGNITGRYRVLDALYTLGFHYPPRQAFFRSELAHLFALAQEEELDLAALQGSYAGAMGWGQFIPSSYRAYAKDGDGDGRRDLFGSLPDVFASVANYFAAHGWERGEPVTVRALVAPGTPEFVAGTLEPSFPLAELGEKGYRPAVAIGHDKTATLVSLDGAEGREHWIAFKNFYVITRYNRSPLYAMAVTQLAQEIAAGDGAGAAP